MLKKTLFILSLGFLSKCYAADTTSHFKPFMYFYKSNTYQQMQGKLSYRLVSPPTETCNQ